MVKIITRNMLFVCTVLFFSLFDSGFVLSQAKDSSDVFVPKPATGYTDSNYFKNLNKLNRERGTHDSIPRLSKEERLQLYRIRLEELDKDTEEYLHIKSKIEKIENTY